MNPADIIKRKALELAHARKYIIPKVVGNEAVNFALDNFKLQGFMGDVFEPWKRRKPTKKVNNRSLLIKTARGKRSIRVTQADEEIVKIGSPLAYMKAHNEGSREKVAVRFHNRKLYGKSKVGTGVTSKKTGKERMKTVTTIKGVTEVKAHMRQMRLPKRQFIGKSQYLMARLKRVTAAEIYKALNS